MDWRDVDYKHLLKAMDIIDHIGFEAARTRCNAAIPDMGRGFQPAKVVLICCVGRGTYEYRVLIALGYRLQFPERPPLRPANFRGISFRDFFHAMNNRIGPRFGWTRIVPDADEERAFDVPRAQLTTYAS